MKTKNNDTISQDSYINFLNQVRTDIQQAQLRAALSVTYELTNLYWRIGKGLSEKASTERWGAQIYSGNFGWRRGGIVCDEPGVSEPADGADDGQPRGHLARLVADPSDVEPEPPRAVENMFCEKILIDEV